jgi:hypothetical protein
VHARRIRRVCAAAALGALALSPAAATRSAQDVHFRSPSGNINCRLSATYVDCLVRHATWRRPPAKPASCDLDWAPFEISMSGRTVHLGGCRGDVGPVCMASAGLACRVLRYGQSVAPGQIRCTSSMAGVTCRRRDGRRAGFLIARERYVLYR